MSTYYMSTCTCICCMIYSSKQSCGKCHCEWGRLYSVLYSECHCKWNLNLQYQPHWPLFHGMWKTRLGEQDDRVRSETEEKTLQMQQAVPDERGGGSKLFLCRNRKSVWCPHPKALGRMAQIPLAGTSDSTCKMWSYWCMIALDR